MLAFIPEIVIKDTIRTLLDYVKIDYDNKVDKTETILYRLLYNQTLQRYNFYTQAKTVFLKEKADPRFIEVNMMFNRDRQQTPTVHIMLPSENEADMTLGIGQGEIEYYYDEINSQNAIAQRTFNKRFRANYNIVITSDNINEVILIYHVLRSLLISANEHLNMSGIFNIKLGGRDIQINSDLVPPHLFMKSISLDCEYEVGSIELLPVDYANDFTITGLPELDESVSI